MEAEPVEVIGDKIRIKREDGQEFNLSPDLFIEADRQYLIDWGISRLAKHDRLFELEYHMTGKKDLKYGSEVVTEEPMLEDLLDDGYILVNSIDLRLMNKSGFQLNNVVMEYIVEYSYRYKGKEYGESIRRGTFPAATMGRDRVTHFITFPSYLSMTKSDYGNFRTTIGGVWIKIIRDGEMIFEYAHPSSIKSRY